MCMAANLVTWPTLFEQILSTEHKGSTCGADIWKYKPNWLLTMILTSRTLVFIHVLT